ncbi:FAD/NAD(P)-binding protein [Apilactobacillus bombintestini]|uniref:Oxidoreductase n=1 Tax=Apilactobacillus bombintestini TaxID=2419772 RepID=A0A387ANM6_9LACO|nr:FAD/NAD(P)-binding protein [Apilactobacillus bombintestini]AYF92282.1 oxidoreductase [Apilactobacillus bombintestini]
MKIGIIGAGPRGLLTLNNLIQNFADATDDDLTIHLFDRAEAGGRVWKVKQPINLIMNSPANELSLFNDGQSHAYSISQWAQSELSTDFIKSLHVDNQQELLDALNKISDNSYVPRAICGAYCQWFFTQLVNEIKNNPHVDLITHFNTNVDKVDKHNDNWVVSAQNVDYPVDKLVFSLGQQENKLTNDQKSLQKYAKECDLTYILPKDADEADLSSITHDQTVIIRGMGLSFNDYVSRLTEERGGYFTNNGDNTLTYHPSGKEPTIYAGSRRGIPYYPKAISQKQYDENYSAVFLTKENIDKLTKNDHLAFADFQKLLRLDIEYRYYSLLIAHKHPEIDLKDFQEKFSTVDNVNALIGSYHFDNEEVFDWDTILNPVAGVKITTLDDYQQHIQKWLNFIINDACLGSKTGPVTGALEMLRDLRDNIRYVLSNHLLTNDEWVQKFLGQFSSNVKFLSMGAPVIRSQEILALMKQGIVKILGPQMKVIGANHHFMTCSFFYSKEIIPGDVLIEARTNPANTRFSANPVITSLMDENIIHPLSIELSDGQSVDNPSVDIDIHSDQVVNQKDLYTWGLNTEGLYFVTSAIPRPGVNDAILTAAQDIARNMLNLSVDQPTTYM